MGRVKYLIAGNWKMNKVTSDASDLAKEIQHQAGNQTAVNVVVCPPFTSLQSVSNLIKDSNVQLGAQNMSAESSGAFTGEVSAEMLRDLLTNYVILGHSERRAYYGETDEVVNRKVHAALENSLKPIFCVGETLEQREAGQTLSIIQDQIKSGLIHVTADKADSIVVAYEPVWAIGTGKTATPEMAQEVHSEIRKQLSELFNADVASKIKILYGGSMKPENADELLAQEDIDGGLIGGAALNARSFCGIIESAIRLSA
jgi:triosephosphate isomerase|tara:strand:+ start:441 stop:1214 length:774 start_codon:yes stop_codon:yes gene_type:complete